MFALNKLQRVHQLICPRFAKIIHLEAVKYKQTNIAIVLADLNSRIGMLTPFITQTNCTYLFFCRLFQFIRLPLICQNFVP